MGTEIAVPLFALFMSVALVSGVLANFVLTRSTPERKRLSRIGDRAASASPTAVMLTDTVNPVLEKIGSYVPKSPKDMGRLERRLATAGYRNPSAAVIFSISEILVPAVLALSAIWYLGPRRGWMVAAFLGIVGYMLPGFLLAFKTEKRKKQIGNGLPDALDLLIVCIEAGSGLDQAIVKVSEELHLAYPALAEELRLITAETRAGKPRLDAFRNFAQRTQVDDVRSFVAMLVQTDKFGTSIAQALRTHADTSRTKRRQRAEERAAKLTVKLIFPLVFCLFPAFYVVVLGPAVIKILRVFIQGQLQ